MSATAHLDESALQQYLEGAFPSSVRQLIETHVDLCASCRQVLATLGTAFSTKTHEASQGVITDEIAPEYPAPGHILSDRFKLTGYLGRGAMGVVFSAEDLSLGGVVAIKVLAPHIARRADVLEILGQEIMLGRKISHPNACRLHDLGMSGGLPYITMQFIEGSTLEALCQSPVPRSQAVDLLLQVSSVLAAAHTAGVVHRDLKPTNIMIRSSGQAVVMDFGLARDVKGAPSHAGPVGTPAYWSPEQARGETATERSDVYSFGLLAYQLFTGTVPRKHAARLSYGKIPAPYRGIVRQCLEEVESRRFASAVGLNAALQAAPKRHRNRRLMQGSLAVVVSVIAGAVSGWWWVDRQAPKTTEPALAQSYRAPPAPAMPRPEPGPVALAPEKTTEPPLNALAVEAANTVEVVDAGVAYKVMPRPVAAMRVKRAPAPEPVEAMPLFR